MKGIVKISKKLILHGTKRNKCNKNYYRIYIVKLIILRY